eukprot:TRINITY_DN8344_c0_g1_i5.p1 TRINITY_DN8344_c0_g1~~TRINITY_DN8344_c0_g1_i5.p1  ORF type:complete len:308 (+),score=58.82 TRINITY_DN8344_c0_g1_i5:283-1206(+)
MGYPCQNLLESAWRNSISDVSKVLNARHFNKFQVYNLTEQSYDDHLQFGGRVVHFPITDHHPPPLSMLMSILQSMSQWLAADSENVVVVHCLAGKGRTGTIIASYLLWSQVIDTAESALDFFASRRSQSHQGVMVPSQRRYVGYIEHIVYKRHDISHVRALQLGKIFMRPVPNFNMKGGCIPFLEIVDPVTKNILYRTPTSQLREYSKDECAFLDVNFSIRGDVLLKMYHVPTTTSTKTNNYMFRTSFHTNFVQNYIMDLSVYDLDGENNVIVDKRFSSEFSMRILFAEVPVSVDGQNINVDNIPSI